MHDAFSHDSIFAIIISQSLLGRLFWIKPLASLFPVTVGLSFLACSLRSEAWIFKLAHAADQLAIVREILLEEHVELIRDLFEIAEQFQHAFMGLLPYLNELGQSMDNDLRVLLAETSFEVAC